MLLAIWHSLTQFSHTQFLIYSHTATSTFHIAIQLFWTGALGNN